MKSEVKFKVRSLNFAQPVRKFTSDFIRDKKMCCHMDDGDAVGQTGVELAQVLLMRMLWLLMLMLMLLTSRYLLVWWLSLYSVVLDTTALAVAVVLVLFGWLASAAIVVAADAECEAVAFVWSTKAAETGPHCDCLLDLWSEELRVHTPAAVQMLMPTMM